MEKQLIEIGLSLFESKVYLGLLQRKMTTAGALAKHLNLKRSTVYTILDSLIEKGLVSMTQIEAVKHYQAESPDRIREFLEQKKEQITKQESLFQELYADLSTLHQKQILAPKITIYEGQNGVQNLLQRNLDDHPSEVLVFGEYLEEEDHIPHYTQRRIKMGIPTRVIIPDGEYSREVQSEDKVSNRKTYIVTNKYRFPASIHVYDQSVAIFTYNGQDPVGVYIENEDIALTMKMIFQLVETGMKTIDNW